MENNIDSKCHTEHQIKFKTDAKSNFKPECNLSTNEGKAMKNTAELVAEALASPAKSHLNAPNRNSLGIKEVK